MDRFQLVSGFMCRDGLAKQRGMRNLCRKKACLVSTDQKFLIDLLYEVSKSNDCFEVKFSSESREGMYLGICQFTNDSSVGDLWARFETHPKIWVVIHDEDFNGSYRSKIRSWQP
jgi:hypothetical protein